MPLITSANTNSDLNNPATTTVNGTTDADAFLLDSAANTGDDTLVLQKHDSLLTTRKIFDGNNDGIITFGGNGTLDVDKTGPSAGQDSLTLPGINPQVGLRYLGSSDGYFVYADASVRLKGFKEGTVGNNALNGTASNDSFFYDTALGLRLGDDTITNFSATDRLITTTKIFDSNGDNIVTFGGDGVLGLPGSQGNEVGSPGGALGGTVQITDTGGNQVTELQHDGVTTVNGVDYYIYSLVGGASNTALP
ncbi:MAG TPA: hypothetical protein VJR87_05770 [Allosphingosinicella sp.]|nr:hypothetical protein [Allosphingosinicella sp.]